MGKVSWILSPQFHFLSSTMKWSTTLHFTALPLIVTDGLAHHPGTRILSTCFRGMELSVNVSTSLKGYSVSQTMS